MTISQTNFEAIRVSYAPIFAVLEKAFAHFGIDFYLIGAQSRDVWINHLSLTKRTTNDIDFAVMMNDQSQWNELVKHFTQEQNFIQDPDHPFRFYLGSNMLDLIPFGGIEKNGEVILENPLTELSVYGCREVTEDAVVISGKYKVITLPGLCIMKLIAFDEKPDQRAKDFEDFNLVMKNYGEIAGEELFSNTYEDLIQADFELSTAAARMLGRNMQTILNKNEILKNRITAILESKLQKFSKQEIDQMYLVNEKDDRLIFQLKLIAEVLRGISD
jgi:predicted nucleotidyltransferase